MLGLKNDVTLKIAVHWVVLEPKTRSSIPHAESIEEEFVYVAEGRPHVWINGYLSELEPGFCVGFPAGTGIVHSFFNFTNEPVALVVLGDRTKKENKYIYPVNPELKSEHEEHWWKEWPEQELGPHKGEMKLTPALRDWREVSCVKKVSELKRNSSFSYKGDNETFSEGVRLTDHLQMKSIGVWHEILKPFRRTSWPHAHKLEEEFAVVLKGRVKAWVNGHIQELGPGEKIFFPPGTGLNHCLINETTEPVEFLGIGQANDAGEDERIVYAFHDNRNQENKEKGWLWENAPTPEMGPHLDVPRNPLVKVEKVETAQTFLNEAMPELLKKEAEYNLILGFANAPTVQHFLVKESGVFSGCALLTDKNLILSQIPGPHVLRLVESLNANGVSVPGVVGPAATVETFARFWNLISTDQLRPSMSQKIYQLDQVTHPAESKGHMKVASLESLELVAQWLGDFQKEIIPEEWTAWEQRIETAQKRIAAKQVFFWNLDSKEPQAMCMVSRPTENGITVSCVYTPPENRKKGYASALVAKTCEEMLRRGKKFCALYTDTSNPTSNRIYQSIGFYEVARSKHYRTKK